MIMSVLQHKQLDLLELSIPNHFQLPEIKQTNNQTLLLTLKQRQQVGNSRGEQKILAYVCMLPEMHA
jgi:hypothetical protein